MFAPDWEAGCKSCSFWADSFNGITTHLAHRDVTLMAVSRAPVRKLEAFAQRAGPRARGIGGGLAAYEHPLLRPLASVLIALAVVGVLLQRRRARRPG